MNDGTHEGDSNSTEAPALAERIVRDPAVLAGKPVVRGTRVAVEVVLDYLAHKPNFDDLFADYPRLTMEDVRACLGYAHRLVTEAGRPLSR